MKTKTLYTALLLALIFGGGGKILGQNTANGHEFVDLGLPSGLLWATCNIGATNPEDYGDYYAWGEVETKTNYDWSTYKWSEGEGTDHKLTKYNTIDYKGTVDDKTVLDPDDDVAHVLWKGDWRIPTREEVTELLSNCTRTWTEQNGVSGYRITGSNGKSIFMPAQGRYEETAILQSGTVGRYWLSGLNSGQPDYALIILFDSDEISGKYTGTRRIGQAIRPVMSKTSTGIDAVSDSQTTAGESATARRYNLSGQRVGTDYRGIVIENGRKRIIK